MEPSAVEPSQGLRLAQISVPAAACCMFRTAQKLVVPRGFGLPLASSLGEAGYVLFAKLVFSGTEAAKGSTAFMRMSRFRLESVCACVRACVRQAL